MKFHAITHAVPELVIDNDQALMMFRDRNHGHFSEQDLDEMERKIRAGLELTGIKKRHITPPGLPVGHLVLDAARRAMQEADTAPEDIDLVLYVGIGRGWLEPAMASWVQHELGLTKATGFDILDACASWMRGLDTAQAFLEQGHFKRVLLVNSEAGMSAFANLSLTDTTMMEQAFAIFTVGEAATATILSNANPEKAHIRLRTFPEGFDWCLIPLSNAACYAPDTIGKLDPGRFYAASDKIVSTSIRRIVQTYRSDDHFNHGAYDIFFSHSASGKAIEIIAAQLGLPIEKYVSTHEEYGNTSSASIPLAMSLALEKGQLKRGDRALAVVGSAGVTIGLASFTF
ncbi:3-oxoacyl-[acyl-carrier-protein] synthase III C-terminal domain-containing protein [Cohaesibacter intestini]|uniref:3-oxoacyl-[acyl-carrier-protein] synthase III C-terminal domain-containing protein n=1 Tax=Cohaesibacter intestini TaxID=2211145 RepID=UPI000DE84435|nr:3-oxoacyl-[acyl-carrier-protein] synthase III C-terminal domain-containing protein [Cohaesibacter intestini]